MKRDDDYQVRRQSVANWSDKALEQRFWQLGEQIGDPLLKLGYEETSPPIEPSGLLRMGFSSIEARAIADGCVEQNLLGHGAGNVVYRLAKAKGMEYIDAGRALCEGRLWDEAAAQF